MFVFYPKIIAIAIAFPVVAKPIPFACTSPVPLGIRFILILLSPPDAVNLGALPVAALAKVNSLTAELVAVNRNNSFPLVSKIEVPILGAVKVLFVRVCVPVRVTSPALPKVASKRPVFVATPSR